MPIVAGRLRFERIVVPTPYAVGPANVYVLLSEPITLFDCGPNTPAAENALLLGLAAVGLAPQQIGRVVISHGHPDHYGLAPRLREASRARILVGALDRAKLDDASMLTATGRLLLQAGMPMDQLLAMGEREREHRGLRPRVENVETLAGGEVLEFEDVSLDVLHLPGHTAGHICLVERETGTLFSGDTLLLDISPNPLLEPDPRDPTERRRSLVEYLGTLDRLSSMDLSTVYPGHGPPIEHPHDLIEEMRRHHRQRTERIADLLRESEDGKSGWQLARELFPSLEGFDNFLAVSEAVAHVDLLVMDGRAEMIERDGVRFFRLLDRTARSGV